MPLVTMLTLTALLAPPLAPAVQTADTACQVLHPNNVPVEGRKSPLDSITNSRTIELVIQNGAVAYSR